MQFVATEATECACLVLSKDWIKQVREATRAQTACQHAIDCTANGTECVTTCVHGDTAARAAVEIARRPLGHLEVDGRHKEVILDVNDAPTRLDRRLAHAGQFLGANPLEHAAEHLRDGR